MPNQKHIASQLLTDSSAIHQLKLKKCYFYAVKNGTKTFEIRKNSDRGFQKGDIVSLHEVETLVDGSLKLTGESVEGVITYVTNYEQKDDYVVFGFELCGNK